MHGSKKTRTKVAPTTAPPPAKWVEVQIRIGGVIRKDIIGLTVEDVCVSKYEIEGNKQAAKGRTKKRK